MSQFEYVPLLELGPDLTDYELINTDYVKSLNLGGQQFLSLAPEGLTFLARRAFHQIAFFLRPAHNQQVANILKDPQASSNDKFVAQALLANAVVSAEEQLPFCQDTGTATIIGKKGQFILTACDDEAALARGVWETYQTDNLRYSQTAALNMYTEQNTGNNLPAQIDLYATSGAEYHFLFVAKGGGSANKTYLFQETKALLNPGMLQKFLVQKMLTLGTAACPPYHLAFVIGGLSAEGCLKTVKLASSGYLDNLPTVGNALGQAFRDLELEKQILEEARACGIGAQFGGRHFAHDVRVIRMPRHGASCPIGMGVSCSADRNVKAKINAQGIWLEKLDQNPAVWLEKFSGSLQERPQGVAINLNQPMESICAELSKYPIKTLVALSGKMVVARDIAHAKIKARLDSGQEMPEYLKNHPVYYAGPAKTPKGMASGSFGPTTAGRMDDYVECFQAQGGSKVMIAKGNRSKAVTLACQKYGGFYLGSIGGPAAVLAKEHIRSVKVLEYPELGMEAVWEIEVQNFPAVILVDDKGNDFFASL